MRLLLVEDNERLSQAVATGLHSQGFTVDVAGSAAEAVRAWQSASYDAAILDLMLPDGSGLDVLAKLRADGGRVPVLILTALGDIEHRVHGLDCGADDYLVKPFAMQELVARVRALLRRPGAALGRVLTLGDVSLDTSSRIATVAGASVDLTRSELMVLETLLRHQGRVLSKERLGEALHDFDTDWSDNSIEVQVHRLRKKLVAAGATATIRALRGLGYIAS